MPLGRYLSRGRLAGPLLGLLLLACPVRAQSCSATLVPVAFGIYNPRATTPNSSTGTATVNCTGILGIGVTLLVGYEVRLGPGGSGNQLMRQMRNANGKTLNYTLRANSATGSIWGDNLSGTTMQSGGWLLGVLTAPRVYTIYGRIPALQNAAVGSYSDSVLVTVSF